MSISTLIAIWGKITIILIAMIEETKTFFGPTTIPTFAIYYLYGEDWEATS